MVEDESDLMQLYCEMLCGAGHEVDGFTDPLVACSHFHEKPDRYDVVISDIRMQGMTRIQWQGN